MKKLSTGKDSTLANWIELSKAFFGPDSKQTNYLVEKAEKAKNGMDEEVVADESQLLYVLLNMDTAEKEQGEVI